MDHAYTTTSKLTAENYILIEDEYTSGLTYSLNDINAWKHIGWTLLSSISYS